MTNNKVISFNKPEEIDSLQEILSPQVKLIYHAYQQSAYTRTGLATAQATTAR